MPLHTSPTNSRRAAERARDQALPRHIGFIPDGNRRWARRHGRPTADGFRAGAERIAPVLDLCAARGIDYVTLWMMSDRNLLRSVEELTSMVALAEYVVALLSRLRRWRLRLIGQLDLLPPSTAKLLAAATESTADLVGPVVNLAVGYAGRADIVTAMRALLLSPDLRGVSGERIAETLTTEHIGQHLSTGGQPDPDLVIRTSGEIRLSGFMTWQTTDSELYFSDKLWPDFDERELQLALAAYRDRDRRFGR
jgi:short-chain Z-isoprenyl diphosphate synthase